MDIKQPPHTSRPEPTTRVGGTLVGLTRCAACHDGIDLEATPWLACQRCLARQHDGCWSGASGCAACGATRALATHPVPRRRWPSVLLAMLFGAGIGLTGAFVALRARPMDAAPAALMAKVEPTAPPVVVDVPDHILERLAFLVNEGRVDDARRLVDERFRNSPAVAAELHAVLRSGDLRVPRTTARPCCIQIDLSNFSR